MRKPLPQSVLRQSQILQCVTSNAEKQQQRQPLSSINISLFFNKNKQLNFPAELLHKVFLSFCPAILFYLCSVYLNRTCSAHLFTYDSCTQYTTCTAACSCVVSRLAS